MITCKMILRKVNNYLMNNKQIKVKKPIKCLKITSNYFTNKMIYRKKASFYKVSSKNKMHRLMNINKNIKIYKNLMTLMLIKTN